jgi:VanZ family protein
MSGIAWRSMWFRYCLFLLCASAVAYGIFRPTPPPLFFHQSDKVGHVLAFISLALTARLAFVRVRWFFFWPVLIALAPLLEYLQGEWQPSRVYSIEDSYANLSGVAIAFLLVLVLKTSVRYRNR